MKTTQISSLAELASIADEVLASYVQKNTAQVVSLVGDLGAGKTAFTKELARHLGVSSEITSPTFVIMKSYPLVQHPFFKTLIHIDAYRIEADDEMRVLGFAELLQNPTNLICIEWPERIQSVIPTDAHTVSIVLNPDGTRNITYGN